MAGIHINDNVSVVGGRFEVSPAKKILKNDGQTY
jgi:hypothetical protein